MPFTISLLRRATSEHPPTDLYYLEPRCVPPDGMVLISGPEHVEQMMQAHEGRKKCDQYIVRNGAPSDGSDDDMSEEVAYIFPVSTY